MIPPKSQPASPLGPLNYREAKEPMRSRTGPVPPPNSKRRSPAPSHESAT